MELNEKLQELRKQKRLTQEELADSFPCQPVSDRHFNNALYYSGAFVQLIIRLIF